MKGRLRPDIIIIFSVILFFAGCGIPTFINLDYNITWTQNEVTTLTIDADGLVKIDEYAINPGPGIKLFYTLSNNSTNTGGLTSLSVQKAFNSYIRREESGNGISLRPPASEEAPAFYLYTPNTGASVMLSLKRPEDSIVDEDKPHILVGTYSFRNNGGNYQFSRYTNMDVLLTNTPNTIQIKKQGSALQLLYNDNAPMILGDYRKKNFPDSANANVYIKDLKDTDPLFFDYLYDATELYLHIWVSLYGGEGDFTNIYWSRLQDLGIVQLF